MAVLKTAPTTEYADIFNQYKQVSISTLFLNWLSNIIRWWYIAMPVWYILSMRRVLTVIDDKFSISLLITNFFVSWHRDNSFVGFFIGIIMKLLFIPIGLFILLTTLFSYMLFILLWLLIPMITILGILSSPFLTFI